MPDRDPLKFLQRQQQQRRNPREFLQRQQPQPDQMRFDLSGGPPSVGGGAEPVGMIENIGIGAAGALNDYVIDPILALSDAIGKATSMGDFSALGEIARSAGVSVMDLLARFDPTGTASAPVSAGVQEIAAEQTARRAHLPAFRTTQAVRESLNRRAAQDQSIKGKVLRFLGAAPVVAGPGVATAVASGGSVPALSAVAALQSAAQPEGAALNVALASAPLPAAGALLRGGRDVIRRAFGKGAAELIEAEARAGGRGVVTGAVDDMAGIRAVAPAISGQIRASGVAAEGPAIRAASASLPSDSLNAAIQTAAKQVPQGRIKRALGELSAFPRAMMSSLDISAPGRQGAILAFAPSRWGDAIRAGGRMFQSFKPQHYDRIVKEIGAHADAGAANDAGLYLAFREGAEELFTSRIAAKVPGVVRSQRMYETYLDSLRMSTFSSYKKIIDAQALTIGQREQAYRAAAQWINIATGRGSLGKNFDKAVPLLSQFIFAPRYAASRFNVLNPAMYYRNFRDPATRIVAKRQMRDLAEYVGVVGLTMGLAKFAGADVSLSPSSPDFLKIKVGNTRYDAGAGLQQGMRLAIRTIHDLYRAAKGEKAEHGQDVGAIALRFLRSKAAPVPSYFADFFTRKTYEGRKFTATEAGRGILERVTPLAWSDFAGALLTEGLGQAAMTLPGFAGVGVQSFEDEAQNAAIEKLQPLLTEYGRFQRELPEVHRAKDESEQEFSARRQVYNEAMSHFGLGLLDSPEYREADEATKRRALLELLPRRIGSALMRQGESWQLQPKTLLFDARESIQSEQKREPRRLYGAQGERLR